MNKELNSLLSLKAYRLSASCGFLNILNFETKLMLKLSYPITADFVFGVYVHELLKYYNI